MIIETTNTLASNVINLIAETRMGGGAESTISA